MIKQNILSILGTITRSYILVIITTGHIISASASASSSWYPKNWHPVFALGAGTSFGSDLGETQHFPIQNPVTDEFYDYFAKHSSQTSALFDVLLGVEWKINSDWIAQTGIDFNTAPRPFTARGILVQGADPQSADTYIYQYQSVSRQLLFHGKLLYTLKTYYHPYIFAGLGPAFNSAFNYATTVPFDLTFTRMYANHSNTSFSYALGVGIDVDITANMRAGIGYRYTDLGKIQLGTGIIDTTLVAGTLVQSNTQTNQILAQLTWIFN